MATHEIVWRWPLPQQWSMTIIAWDVRIFQAIQVVWISCKRTNKQLATVGGNYTSYKMWAIDTLLLVWTIDLHGSMLVYKRYIVISNAHCRKGCFMSTPNILPHQSHKTVIVWKQVYETFNWLNSWQTQISNLAIFGSLNIPKTFIHPFARMFKRKSTH